MDTLVLPVDIRRITVFSSGQDLLAEARLDPAGGTGSAVATDSRDNRVVLSLEETKGVPFQTGDSPESRQPLDLGRLEWLPHIDYLAPEGLLKRGVSKRELHILVDKIAFLGVLKTLDTIKSLEEKPTGHLAKYVSWMERERDKMSQRNCETLIEESEEWCSMSSNRWTDLMDTFLQQVDALGDAEARNVARFLHDASQHQVVVDIFRGETNPLEVMLADDRLAHLYRLPSGTVDGSDFFHLCGHVKPTMKILEIGAGTGGTTDRALSALVTKDGVRLFSQYVYTDVSPGFLSSAKERLKDVKGLEYKTLNIEENPAEQGFELGSFDLVIASNVLHATSSLKDSLRHVRSLVRPGGRLYLEELAKPLHGPTIPFIMGRLPGWWVGDEDGRPDEPYISVKQWDEKLREAGFSGVDTAVTDDDFPYWMCAHITSRAITNAGSPKPEAVVFLYKDYKVDFAQELASMFQADGVDVHWQCIRDGGADRTVKHVISTIDLEGPFFHDISEGDYKSFISYLSSPEGRGLLWLTRPAQIRCSDPRYGVVNGLSRTIRVELLVDFWTVELEDLTTASAKAASAISRQFWAREPLKHGVDAEFWVGQEGTVHVGRYHWTSLPSALEPDLPKTDPKQLMIGQYGMLDSLGWVQQGQRFVGSDEVELDVRCVGLNFKARTTCPVRLRRRPRHSLVITSLHMHRM
jgi:SAM-dependent methyltransferase